MTEPDILHIGLDVHKDSITIAVAEPGRGGEVRAHPAIANDLNAVQRWIRGLLNQYAARDGNGVALHFCYEAGPCGFVLARRLMQLGHACSVVAPSLIPRCSGQKVKTDRLDAIKLARLLRAGELTAIYIPEVTDEAMRDLCRARSDAVDDRHRAKRRLKSFLLIHGYRYPGRANWGPSHMAWLRELVLPHPAMKAILEEDVTAVRDAVARVERCEQAMALLLPSWRLREAVEALMAFKGFDLVAAMVIVSELGDMNRFAHPRQLMGYLGLVPSEHSSGESRRQGPITKCGNPHARWMLVESSQHYFHAPKVSRELTLRQQGRPAEVCKVSWRAQHRLHGRATRLLARRLHRNKVVVALARELVGFIWEALRPLCCYQQAPNP